MAQLHGRVLGLPHRGRLTALAGRVGSLGAAAGVVGVLAVGVACALATDSLKWSAVIVEWATPVWVTPEFSLTAIIGLAWSFVWEDMESGRLDPRSLDPEHLPRLPKTIDFTVDYLRSGLPRDAYARARVNRSGRRYASVHVEAWQDNRARLFAQATGHFLTPERGLAPLASRDAGPHASPDAGPDA